MLNSDLSHETTKSALLMRLSLSIHQVTHVACGWSKLLLSKHSRTATGQTFSFTIRRLRVDAGRMHQAWDIFEIRQNIFDCMKSRELARMAQINQFFFEFATNELWKTITCVSSFVSCLPQSCRSEPLHKDDVRRLDFYASKIQNLSLKYKRGPPQNFEKLIRDQPTDVPLKSWDALWEEIAQLRPNTHFLPNIRRLHVENCSELILAPLIAISGSNLAHIHFKYIRGRSFDSLVKRFFGGLQDTSHLEYIFLLDRENELMSSNLIRQSPLQHIRLESTSFSRFPLRQELLTKPTLESLSIHLTSGWYSDEIRSLKGKYLSNLKALRLKMDRFEDEQCETSCARTFSRYPNQQKLNQMHSANCQRRSSIDFFEGFDNPELTTLQLIFPAKTTGNMFLDVVAAARDNCHLQNLTELVFAGHTHLKSSTPRFKTLNPPAIVPWEFREGLDMLLPMHQLKTLRLSVAPNFLDVLDLQLYKAITDGIPTLEKLRLGHEGFAPRFNEERIYQERVSLRHVAAFCHMLLNLKTVSVGTVDYLALEETPYLEWACPSVQSLSIKHWHDRDEEGWQDKISRSLRIYFPAIGKRLT